MQITHFYLLEDDTLSTYTRSVCQLVDQVWSQGLALYLYCDTEEKARQLDDDLWTFKDIRFIPHELLAYRSSTVGTLPLCLIGSSDIIKDSPPCEVLFNLTETVPQFFPRYKKILEVVPVNEVARVASRKRYKHYQEAGYSIKTQHYRMV